MTRRPDAFFTAGLELRRYGTTPYFVSRCGKVFHEKKQVFLKIHNGRYETVHLKHGDYRTVTKPVHHLVAHVWIGHRPPGMQINHKNGIRNDNRVENLEYVTPLENVKHAIALGLYVPTRLKKHSKKQYEEVKRLIRLREKYAKYVLSNREIGLRVGMSHAAVRMVHQSMGGRRIPCLTGRPVEELK